MPPRRIAQVFMILHLDPDEPRPTILRNVPHKYIKRRAILRVSTVPPPRRILKLNTRNLMAPPMGQSTKDVRRQLQLTLQVPKQIERQRLTGKQIIENARPAIQLVTALDRIEHFLPNNLTNCLIKKIHQMLLCPRHRQQRPQSPPPKTPHRIAMLNTPHRLQNPQLPPERARIHFFVSTHPCRQCIYIHRSPFVPEKSRGQET